MTTAEFLGLGKPHNIVGTDQGEASPGGVEPARIGIDDGSDLGFRVFKLDSSNIRAWEPDRTDMAGSLLDYIDHIKPDRSEDDLFYELLLKLGYDLCAPVERREIAGKRVNAVAGTAHW